jgi:hypothetical protein
MVQSHDHRLPRQLQIRTTPTSSNTLTSSNRIKTVNKGSDRSCSQHTCSCNIWIAICHSIQPGPRGSFKTTGPGGTHSRALYGKSRNNLTEPTPHPHLLLLEPPRPPSHIDAGRLPYRDRVAARTIIWPNLIVISQCSPLQAFPPQQGLSPHAPSQTDSAAPTFLRL